MQFLCVGNPAFNSDQDEQAGEPASEKHRRYAWQTEGIWTQGELCTRLLQVISDVFLVTVLSFDSYGLQLMVGVICRDVDIVLL